MVERLKYCLISILLLHFLCGPVVALDLDTSIDDDIRKNYNPNKIEDDMALPKLPKVLNEKSIQPNYIKPAYYPKTQTSIDKIPYKQKLPAQNAETFAVLKKGTALRVKLLNSISDRSQEGSKVAFISRYPVSTTYFTIPMGTMFYGEIANSHGPQLSANGGLIVININSVVLNNQIHPIDAYVTKVNFKNVYLNNIKGKRKYISSMFNSMKPGCHFLRKMVGVSGNLAQDGSSIIVVPFALVLGVLAAGGNIFISPALALFYKGDSIYVKEGSEFEIKLSQDIFIHN